MSFNLDDPLAGILSDGSDDSFFDDDVLGKKKPKGNIIASTDKKKSIFNLDTDVSNLEKDKNDSLQDFSKPDPIKVPTKSNTSPTPAKKNFEVKNKSYLDLTKSPAKPKTSASAHSLDILSEMNVPKKDLHKNVEKTKTSQSLLDDILGASTAKEPVSLLSRPSVSQKHEVNPILAKGEIKPTSNKVTSQLKVGPAKSSKEEKNQAKSKTADDWLGIFNEKNESEDAMDMPSWLGGGTKEKIQSKVVNEINKPPEQQNINIDEPKLQEETVEKKLDPDLMIPKTSYTFSSDQQLINNDLTSEGAAMYLQQQESQLMVALQLKAQEEKLAAMQLRQKESQRIQREAAMAHHDQLDAMLQRQSQHRVQMQAVINAHQQRITERIKALLGTENLDDNNYQNDDMTVPGEERKESAHSKEKKQLLQLVQSLQENHDKEIDLMETSYRRQLAFLEVSLAQSEERMKEESDKLTKFYSEKINWLEEHHLLFKKLTEENLASLTERHKVENQMLSQQHLENVKVLQEHHAALMENIKSAVNLEQSVVRDSATFSTELHQLVTDVRESKSHCQLLVNSVQTLSENSQRDIDRALKVRETQISDMITHLKTDRESFEKEKIENREIINLLEKRLKQMTTLMEDETALLKQKKMELEFEKATFSKQTEFAKNVLKKQDDELKMLKEDIQKEYNIKLAQVNEAKLNAENDSSSIAKEKTSILSLKQELEKVKSQLQMQLDEVNEERLKLNLEKQKMHIEEQRIIVKSRDLDILAKAAIEKQTQADKKYSDAEFLLSKYEERIRRIQEHVVSLNMREKQIAKEKVALSRERLSLHNERKKSENKLWSHCRTAQYLPQYNLDNTYADSFLNVSVSRDHGDLNVNTALNAITREIVSLKMNKNFDVSHPFDANIIPTDDKDPIADNFNAVHNTESMSEGYKGYMDPKFTMLKLDVQQVLSNLTDSLKEYPVPDDAEKDEKK